MSLNITITVTGSDRVHQKMLRLGSSLYDFKDAMTKVGRDGKEYFAGTAWLSQGGVFGNEWSELSAKYAIRKARVHPGKGPLEATGNMRKGFRMYADRNSVFIDNREPYFKYHQSTAPRSKMPRRQMLGISSGFRSLVRTTIQKDVKSKIEQA